MENQLESHLQKTYSLITQIYPYLKVDSFDVVKQVEEYRQFWKPEKVKVALLTESHVYTDEADFKLKMKKTILDRIVLRYLSRFVRFVYCLGYGENELLEGPRTKRKNTGAPQFLKIFSSCTAENVNELGFPKILKRGTRSFLQRLRNKALILQKLKEQGIWLLDASIVGLYGNEVKRNSSTFRAILRLCWDNYVVKILETTQPDFVIVIGKGVEKTLRSRLTFPYETIDLPQAHLSSQQQIENYRRYCEICSSIVNRKPIIKSPLTASTKTEIFSRSTRDDIHFVKKKSNGELY